MDSPDPPRGAAPPRDETAPAGATPGMFLAPDGRPLGYREAVASGISVGVPGLMAMLELAHREQGKLAWSDLFQPAIAAARNGFPVSPRLAAWLQRMPALRASGVVPKVEIKDHDGHACTYRCTWVETKA